MSIDYRYYTSFAIQSTLADFLCCFLRELRISPLPYLRHIQHGIYSIAVGTNLSFSRCFHILMSHTVAVQSIEHVQRFIPPKSKRQQVRVFV